MGLRLTSPRPAGPHPAWLLVASLRQWRRSGTAVLSSRPESSRGGRFAWLLPPPRVFDTGPRVPLLDARGPVPSHPYLAALQRVNQRRVASLHAANRRAPARPLATPQEMTPCSVKPDAFLDVVERVSPGPYVELFARAPRLGWDSWGLGYELTQGETA